MTETTITVPTAAAAVIARRIERLADERRHAMVNLTSATNRAAEAVAKGNLLDAQHIIRKAADLAEAAAKLESLAGIARHAGITDAQVARLVSSTDYPDIVSLEDKAAG